MQFVTDCGLKRDRLKMKSLYFTKYKNSSKFAPKWYARAVTRGEITTEMIAERIEAVASVRKSDVLAVLCELADAIEEGLGQGRKVTLNGIGSFKMAITTGGTDTPEEFHIAKQIKGLRVTFQPVTRCKQNRKKTKKLTEGFTFYELKRRK